MRMGCTFTEMVLVNEPAPIVINSLPTNPSCFGQCDGQIVSTMSGGTSPYNLQWINQATGLNVGNNSTVSNLCAGTYELILTDANFCEARDTVVLGEPDGMVANFTTTTSSCTVCDGTVDVVVTGGAGGYSYNWSPAPGGGQGTPNITGVCSGVSFLEVTDANGCMQTFPVLINSGPSEDLDATSTDVSCYGEADGTVTVTIVGGL